ncbi:MAG: DUF2785 domain-containing protein [Exiguobacterium chiriqhucha]|uniref:DUF2785 domain-containing protein n=1 Tax=Exiguobacterium chiriqhucha TaxID=1385984 RepID=UPI00144F36D8|nr:DUF2785 domain-containing protein [Exiguobacterium chiriqhucha]KAB2865439.1 MAG: DUF2785 domain-containing protein [Exiguobacterium chiriqhucha]
MNEETIYSELDLKVILTDIKNRATNLEELDETRLIQSMLHHIGSTDPELRDQLIYTLFYRFIIEDDHLTDEQLTDLFNTTLKYHLFHGIGETASDTVFTRAFSTLLIALIVYQDRQRGFLSEADLDMLKAKLLAYLDCEIDTRGYVPGKGWAHSIAHVADAFDELVLHPHLDETEFGEMLEALWNKVMMPTVYMHDEDERLLNPIFALLQRGMDEHELIVLLEDLPARLSAQKQQLEPEHYWHVVHNVKTFLNSFFVKLHETDRPMLQTAVLLTLKNM